MLPSHHQRLTHLLKKMAKLFCYQVREIVSYQYHFHFSFPIHPSSSLSLSLAAGGKRDCTPDELAALCKEIQDSSLVKTHTYHLISYKNSFVGRELVEWLMHRKSMRTLSSS